MKSTSRRAKGNSFEYNIEASLKPIYPNIRCLERRGFVRQFDLLDEENKIVIECKFHKSLTWNELEGYFDKLWDKKPDTNYTPYIVFKTNRQPVLVFYQNTLGARYIALFEDKFGVEYIDRYKRKEDKHLQNRYKMLFG